MMNILIYTMSMLAIGVMTYSFYFVALVVAKITETSRERKHMEKLFIRLYSNLNR